jgi:hypothetical protein
MDKRSQFLVHVRVHIGGNGLVQNEIYAIPTQFKAEQVDRDLVPGQIFQVRLILISVASAIWPSGKGVRR